MLLVLFFVFILVLGAFYLLSPKEIKVPPGLKRLPYVRGSFFSGVQSDTKYPICHHLYELSKTYGPLFFARLGTRDILVINNNKSLKTTMKTFGDNFSGRLKSKVLEIVTRKSGILQTDGELWATHRSFLLRVLRDFGFGKDLSAEIVGKECEMVISELYESQRKPVDFFQVISFATANIISKFIMNKRYSKTDKDLLTIAKFLDDEVRESGLERIANIMFPFIVENYWLSKLFLFITGKKKKVDKIHDIFKREIKEHLLKLDSKVEAEDLIDRFLMEQKRLNESGKMDHTFVDWQLIRNCSELFAAGYDTTSTTLLWSMVFLSKHSDVQKKMFDEISECIGTERLPKLSDRKALPYTQAVMDEIFRMSTVVPLAIIHKNFEECNIDGYFIPKSSVIFPNLYACHRDEKVWEKPFDFYPEHFLEKSDDGSFKYNAREELTPFGLGKRQCLGEILAKMEFFVFLTGIIQTFKVSFPKDVSEKEFTEGIIGSTGLIRSPSFRDFIFEPRN